MNTHDIKRYTVSGDIAYPIHEDTEGDYVTYEDHVAAIEADRKTSSKQLAAYKRLTESLEKRLTLLQAQHDELKKSNNPELLASERAANAILTSELEADRKRRQSEAEEVCAEAYQVVGALLDDLGIFETDEAKKILDNLSQARIVHKDVLPWKSADRKRRGEPVAYGVIASNTGRVCTLVLAKDYEREALDQMLPEHVVPLYPSPQPAEPVTIPQTVASGNSEPVKVPKGYILIAQETLRHLVGERQYNEIVDMCQYPTK